MSQEFGVCMLSLVPVRKKPDDRSEMVNQLLFGERIEILEVEAENWILIKSTFDGYVGYIDPKQIYRTTLDQHEAIANPTKYVMESAFASDDKERNIHLTIGANLPNFDGLSFKMPFGKYRFASQIIDLETLSLSGLTIERIARKYINSPYLWGGRSPFGIDCSGLTQVVFKMCGIKLPRDASDQAKLGDTVGFIENIEVGDLAYFASETNRIIHVGIITSDKKILHASGKVRIDTINQNGIYNEDTKQYTHKLRTIKRIVGCRKLKQYLIIGESQND